MQLKRPNAQKGNVHRSGRNVDLGKQLLSVVTPDHYSGFELTKRLIKLVNVTLPAKIAAGQPNSGVMGCCSSSARTA
eukprot:17239-Amphidinium_carterae.1